MSESTTSKEKNCTFTFKKRRGGAGVRRKAVETNSSSEEETVVNRVEKKSSAGPLSARTVNLGKRPRHNYGDSDEEASGQPESIMVSYQSTRSAETSTRDALATSEIQIDTEIGQDARTIFEKSLMVQQELKGKADDKVYRGLANYAQYYEKKDTAQGNAGSSNVRKGPIRAPANIRATVRWDYAPDLCKDYKETGFCGFGDSCKFLHDRSDYKFGWQLEREEHGKGEPDEDMSKYEIHSDEEDLPFKCFICRDSFKHPIVTKCEHYFCETCALTNYKKSKRCFVCGKQTFGVFNPAKKLIDRLKLEDEQRRGRTADADSDEEVFREVSQGPAAPQAGGSSQNEEQPVTEIELIHYDSKAPAIDDDSDDSGDSD